MKSENNMVAGECERCGLPAHRHSGGWSNTCPIIATYKPRIASIQPDAQQGEGWRLVPVKLTDEMVAAWEDACPEAGWTALQDMSDQEANRALVEAEWSAMLAATPSSPALDAATIERCAEIALNPGFIEARDSAWDEGVNYAKRYIAAAIRALPNAEKRHG